MYAIRTGILTLALAAAGCGGMEVDGEIADTSDEVLDEEKANLTGTPSIAMPKAIVDWERQRMWGNHHLEWHIERRWDTLSPSNVTWAKNSGWKRATVQEGAAGNGIAFLAMHRVMLGYLRAAFPKNLSLFTGWKTPPTNPRDKSSPLPHGATTPLDPNMAAAIQRLENDLASFKTDDEFGRYLETTLRPTAGKPLAKTTDKSAGIHNYMHNRFADPDSAYDIGDPSVNLENKMFWRLHGWIDARWTAYRKAKGALDSEPTYVAAMKQAALEVPNGGLAKGAPMPHDPPPDNLRKVWDNSPEP